MPSTESQKQVTSKFTELVEFDFTSVTGGGSVYLASGQEFIGAPVNSGGNVTMFGNTWYYIELEGSGYRSDLTGSIAEPTLRIAVNDLWNVPGWSTQTSGLSLTDYRGIVVKRQRVFYSILTALQPQRYYIKSVDELTPSIITFTLTPSLGAERLDRPSARKLEI